MLSKEQCYQQATLENLSDANGTRQDIIYAAMGLYAKEVLNKAADKEREVGDFYSERRILELINELK